MHRFKIAIPAVVSLLVLGSLSGPALAKRRHPTRPTAPGDTAPATEVEVDTSVRTAVPTPPAEQASEPVVEKTVVDLSPPTAASQPQPRSSTQARDKPEIATTREGSSPDRDLRAGRLTGHVGVGSPLVTVRASRTTRHVGSVNEDFTVVAPIGLGMLLTERWSFDFEFQVSTGVRPEGLTTAIVDPGVIYAWDRLAAGLRVAWQLNENQNIGLVPLVRVVVIRNERANWFIEAAFPSFVQNKQITASASLQTGVGF
jgi:hypothetical protein